jgi:hypothetical protein
VILEERRTDEMSSSVSCFLIEKVIALCLPYLVARGSWGKKCADDVKVNWPDGHYTMGIQKHIEDLKGLFVYAPDTRIKQHPIRFGDKTGEWSCVTGVFEGTFTKPMPIGNGRFIMPTGKAFKMPMCTVGHWKNGVMDEESLFWDNKTYMDQIGLGK